MLGPVNRFLSGAHTLGPLELQLLRAVRLRGDATVRELLQHSLSNAAYTTVMTTLDRLYKKGLLERSLDGRAFRYRCRKTEEELHRSNVAAVLQNLLTTAEDATAPVSFLIDTLTQHDAALLDELEKAVSRKRRELKNKEVK